MGVDDKLKGFASRMITTPGYHIRPEFDLVHTRHLVEARRKKKAGFHLNLAPMVDMFSILVIYLIMNFSADGEIFFISRDLKIPIANAGKPMQSLPLISVVDTRIVFDSSSGISTIEQNDGSVPQLRETLRRIRSIELQLGDHEGDKAQINLQADINTPVEEVKKVMRVLIEEGWTAINFVVSPDSGS
jgi:biopolymer transport protein ExbD